ncbi:MAG: hypothetical protein A4E24_00928 [Methanomethylovorans sp. PtaU1.Bin093]|uniref:hypothetical protein n=2 Tax=Methanomethylovorans TaxID=101191 RepID=UPI0009CB212D|nr:hypothetical protein [Methanomethylovorans sp. PtaU1.Bin093]OPY20838.1 MAG: hypothetical protein A4E24_00928 [Methanomethylovorans sp. PtaU1.Bin093]
MRQMQEAREIQGSIYNDKKLPKRSRINNVLIDVSHALQTRPVELNGQAAIELPEGYMITGREGPFCLRSDAM